ncbi:hypothetical protein [Pseudomonas lijiangensis]|uniref:Uncharacterized protein n=1 Tax=Pseudomonas lijiangensis TaxID=2995658 RepID=A0ABX8HKI1_9PSED|nr:MULTISPECIES: hypothetical protein [Pseudomonas syringae group]MBX8488306.1 hypothetical protein [Pseudomonas cichorii]MBX8498322.1 hypothetical protein [Pseudomonas lijiangensis]MBX8503229.1 hypothetical protein [Pseudomonas lijiangensis]QWU81166.1 hypothetical protein KQP88_13905 [Pseudomonas lijiangensis]
MSLNALQGSITHHCAILVNEMQREDFLALATALRQFNFDEPHGSITLTEPHYDDECCAAAVA